MSPQQLMALVRRHVVAVLVVLILAAGLYYHIEHADPGYTDAATVAFTSPGAGLFIYSQDLLVIDALVTNQVMSQEGQQKVRNAGGTASYDVALINLNDEDFPNYSNPYVTVTTSSANPGDAQNTFSAVMQVMQEDLTSLQAQQGAKPKTWMGLRTIADPSGPIARTGSPKRTFVALAALAIIAAFMIAEFLDRHPVRPRDLLREEIVPIGVGPPSTRGTALTDWLARPAPRPGDSRRGRRLRMAKCTRRAKIRRPDSRPPRTAAGGPSVRCSSASPNARGENRPA